MREDPAGKENERIKSISASIIRDFINKKWAASAVGATLLEGGWQAVAFASFRILHKASKLSYHFLNQFFNEGFGPAKVPIGWPMLFGFAYAVVSFSVKFFAYLAKNGELPETDKVKEMLIQAALSMIDTAVSMMFWEMGYSLGALVLIPLLLGPLGLHGIALSLFTLAICSIIAGLGSAIWDLIKYGLGNCWLLEKETFSLKKAARTSIYAFLLGANFVWCTAALLIPGSNKVVNILCDVLTSLATSIFAGLVTWFKERGSSKSENQNQIQDIDPNLTSTLRNNNLQKLLPAQNDGEKEDNQKQNVEEAQVGGVKSKNEIEVYDPGCFSFAYNIFYFFKKKLSSPTTSKRTDTQESDPAISDNSQITPTS